MALKKLVITSYENEDCTKKLGIFTCFVNPESIKRTYDIGSSGAKESCGKSGDRSIGNGIKSPPKPDIKPQKVESFVIYLDSTGIIKGCDDVSKSIEDFKKVCYNYNGKIHGIPYLKLTWGSVFSDGSLALKCRLSSFSVNYSLFSVDGQPIQAELSCGFTQYLSDKDIAAIEKNSSPDLTHIKRVKWGDSLALMSNDVYNSPKYYLQVARVNKLASIYQLPLGKQMIFPPIEK